MTTVEIELKNGVLEIDMTPAMISSLVELQMKFELPFNIKVLNKNKVVEKPNGNKKKFISVEIEVETKDLQFLLDTINIIDLAIKIKG